MKKNNETVIWVLRFIVSALFIFSAISKIKPSIAAFEHQLVVQEITNICFAPILARFVVAAEFFLGIAFLQNHFFKKFIIPATILMLTGFCIHLSYQIYLHGDTGNCGCMGDWIPMTPSQALIKNIVTLGILIYLWANTEVKKVNKHRYPLAILFVCFAFIFLKYQPECACDPNAETLTPPAPVIEQIIKIDTVYVEKGTKGLKVLTPVKKEAIKKDSAVTVVPAKEIVPRRTSIFAPYTNFSSGATNLDAGRQIVCLFNVDCDHCMNTAKEICELNKTTKLPPVHIIFWGEESQKDAFFKFAGCSYPYMFVDAGKFFRLLDKAPSPPRIVVLNEGNIVGDFSSETFTKAALVEATKK
jgi:hypothetical protein